ncbi:MAG: efflux transporter outer membrane subunit [Opitutales bacterium]|jgi:multidrug efflux system outer membrane protein
MKNGLIHLLILAIVGLALLVMFSGCTVGPNYQRPSVATPASYTDGGNNTGATWKEATPKDDLGKGQWWEMYGDSQLNALEQQASEHNQDLQAAMARVDEARAISRVAKSEFYPTLNADPSAYLFRQSANRPIPPPGPYSSFSSGDITAPLDLSYEADIWGRVRRSYEASKADFQASMADYETVRLALHAEVAQNYFTLRAVDAELSVLNGTIDLRQQSLNLINDRFQNGASSDLDVAQAENALETTQADLANVEKQRAAFEHSLAVLVGTPPESFHLTSPILTGLPPEIPVGTPSDLLERRPDVAQAERMMAAANARIGVAKATFFPVVKLVGTAGFESVNFGSLFDWPSRLWAVGPSISYPIFDGGRNAANLSRAEAVYVETVAEYRQQVLVAFQEVEDGLSGLNLLALQAAAEQRAVSSAQRAYDLANSRYQEGSVSYLYVVDVQRTLLENQREAVQILGQRYVTSVLLVQALGGGWQDSTIKDFYTASTN